MRTYTILPLIAAALLPGVAQSQTTSTSTIGIATVAMPTYAGSNRYRVRALPIIDLQFKDRAYIGSSKSGIGGGAGVYLMRSSTFSFATEISSDQERSESFGDGLAGMGKRGGATFVGGNASYRIGSITAGAGVAIGLGEGEGTTASLNLATQKVYGRRWVAGLSSGATFSNRANMAFDFGVTPEQAVRRQALIDAGDSRLYADEGRAYAPAGGLKQAQVSTSLGYMFSPRMTALAFASGSRLGQNAAASPLARQRNALTGGLGIAFGI